MIIMHIVAYLAIITVNALISYIPQTELRAFLISRMCLLAVYFVCNVIFGLIVN